MPSADRLVSNNLAMFLEDLTGRQRLATPANDYRCPEEVLVQFGLSFRAPSISEMEPWAVGRCFAAAQKLARGDSRLAYVEGYGLVLNVPIQHAWCVTPDGDVIDPALGSKGEVYFGVPISMDTPEGHAAVRDFSSVLFDMDGRTAIWQGRAESLLKPITKAMIPKDKQTATIAPLRP